MWGEDLKSDLKALNDHYSGLPDAEKEKGIMRFAANPPETGDSLVSRLWDRHLRPWRGKEQTNHTDHESEKKLVDHLKRFTSAPTIPAEPADLALDDADVVSIQRTVHKRKGSWWQLPKDMELYDLPMDYFDRYRENIGSVSKSDVEHVAEKYIDPDKAIIVIVGNAAQIREPLGTLGMPIHELDIEGIAIS